jgi:hypothetical protein
MCIFVYTLLGMNNVMTGYMRVSICVTGYADNMRVCP